MDEIVFFARHYTLYNYSFVSESLLAGFLVPPKDWDPKDVLCQEQSLVRTDAYTSTLQRCG